MKTNRKHGFTIVELVVVIAIIAVLAAVLIPTFASIIKKANDSAYLQERTSKQIEDLAEKVENQNYLTWEDFEAVLARELAKVGSTQTADIEKAIKVALAERAGSDNGLSEAQVQKIINEAMSGQLTTAQVEAIVKAAVGNKTVDVNAIANQVIAKLPKTTGITKEEMQKAINEALSSLNISSITEADIEKALAAFGVSTLTEEQIVAIATQIATEVSEKTGNEKIVATLNIRAAGNEKATLYDTFVAMSISDPTTAVKSITAGETILWDSVEKEFVLYKNDNYTGARYWTVSDVISDKWSTYYTGTESTISTTKGFDAGTTTSVTSVTYTNTGSAQDVDVVIRTNGGTLTVNAPLDTVMHYGNADKVDVQEIANASYHEFGDVDLVKVKKGHIALESGSEVLGIYIYNGTTNEIVDTSFEEVKISLASGVDLPAMSRSDVQIDKTNGTKVCTLVTTEEAKDIYLFQNGIYEQVKVADAGSAEKVWVDQANVTSTTDSAANQLANTWWLDTQPIFAENDATRSIGESGTATNNADILQEVEDYNAEKGTSYTFEAWIESGSTEEDTVADLPLRGDGLSWETAFEVYDYNTMQKISDYYNDGPRFFKVVIEKTNNGHIDCDDWNTVYLNGSFDGNGVILDNLDFYLFDADPDQEYILIKNITVNANINQGDRNGRAAAILWDSVIETHLENITIHGYITSSYAAAFIGWANAGHNTTIYLDNCYGDAELAGTSASAVIFAHAWTSGTDDRYIYMTDTLYEGIMSGNYHTFVTACSGGGAKNKEMYVTFNDPSMLSRFRNVCIAILAENTNDNGYQYQWCPGTDILNQSGYGTKDTITGVMGMKNYVRTSEIEVIKHSGSELTIGDLVSITKNSSATSWSARFEVGPNDKNGYGNYVGAYVGPSTLTNNNGTLTTTDIYACTVTVNGDATQSTGYTADHSVFNVVSSSYGTTFGSASITITQYDSDGRLVQIDVWDLTK